MTKKKSTLMRVPYEFEQTVSKITKKRGYKTQTEFLRIEGVKVLQNSDALTDFVGNIFSKKKNKK